MKRTLFTLSLLLLTTAAYAQPIESEPLPAPYTLQGETDPMALGGAPQPVSGPEAPVYRGEAAPPVPPPGEDTITSSETMNPPPSDEAYPDSIKVPGGTGNNAPETPAPYPAPSASDYPNNNVSGVMPEDPSKFENRVFCTLKVSFTNACCGPDAKTGDKVKSYLDSNAGKLTYVRTVWGKEGEFSYCLKINEHKDQAEIYKNLKKIVMEKPSKNAPVTIAGKGFAPFNNVKKAYKD